MDPLVIEATIYQPWITASQNRRLTAVLHLSLGFYYQRRLQSAPSELQINQTDRPKHKLCKVEAIKGERGKKNKKSGNAIVNSHYVTIKKKNGESKPRIKKI